MIYPKHLNAIVFILLIIISIISPLSITIMIIIGALFNFSNPSPSLLPMSPMPAMSPMSPTSPLSPMSPMSPMLPLSPHVATKYLGAIDAYGDEDDYINNDILSRDDASGDDKIACASKRNTHERVIVGSMNRHNLIDKCVREELESAEDIMWWGKNEN